jgi:hypothetical protein
MALRLSGCAGQVAAFVGRQGLSPDTIRGQTPDKSPEFCGS